MTAPGFALLTRLYLVSSVAAQVMRASNHGTSFYALAWRKSMSAEVRFCPGCGVADMHLKKNLDDVFVCHSCNVTWFAWDMASPVDMTSQELFAMAEQMENLIAGELAVRHKKEVTK